MNGEVLIEVEGIWKKFCRRLRHSLWYGLSDLAREMTARPHRGADLRTNEFWALRDVSFSVRRGEMMALIGRNGAGKSTLLKMLNGVMRPDKGRITVRGRVQALIELGAGFSPILSARENVYINAAVLGMRRADVDRALPEIIDFAGLEDFVETPLQSFSSGMKARLAFAVATQLDPDVLLIDEVLAVGDMAFQEKCMRRMEAFRRSNKAIIFVTHSLYQVEALCNRALWLDDSGVVCYGAATDVVRAYLDTQEKRAIAEAQAEGVAYQSRAIAATRTYFQARDDERAKVTRDALSRSEPVQGRAVEILEPSRSEPIQIRAVEILDGTGQPCTELPFLSDVRVRIQYEAMEPIERPLFGLKFCTEERDVFEASMLADGPGPEQVEGPGVVECRIPRLPLTPKAYRVVLSGFRSGAAFAEVMTMRTVAHFRVTDEGLNRVPMRGPLALTHLRQGSPVYVPRTWHFYNGHGGEPVATVEAYVAESR
jgi:ABC-type polysaccharide/polyol phosphate transport system ATPase subunit